MATSIHAVEQSGFPVYSIHGYFDEAIGRELNALADQQLIKGKVCLIVDLTDCPVMNSMGVAQLLELTVRVVEDFAGHLLLVGVNSVVLKVIKLAGVVPQAELSQTLTQALTEAQKV
ncbi:MAG TPA: STAS domain-containing protein [Candidatus Ozemobacteraceae bacterium]|nr:STAS domain-containing protein [Candidatus Ozemobacteraceae bacterium]